MKSRKPMPVALTIAGSDSGGGAGIQADLKTFAALGVHGTTAITCLTAQNPREVRGIQAARPAMVGQQLDALFLELQPHAVKTGMLYSASIIRTVADHLRPHRGVPLIVDPVMVSTSGAPLLQDAAIRILQRELLPLATLVTPNLDEAEILTGLTLREPEDLRVAVRDLFDRFGNAWLIKGGHWRGGAEAVDLFYDGETELLLSAPLIKGVSTHGTGCTYSAAIAGYHAQGCSLSEAVQQAKEFITQAIAQSHRVGRHWVLNPFFSRSS